MCGIVGAVGKSNNDLFTYNILTNLMNETQRRGPHSTGHYLVESKKSSHDFFKSPVPAHIYTKMREWKKIKKLSLKAFIGHTRYKTKGEEYNNLNNHPHVSIRENLALVHNGNINLFEKYQKDYPINGESDSEMLLRIIIKENNIINGIKKIFELFGSTGDFSCEIIYRNSSDGHTRFFFFRDSGRPCRFIDATQQLGQYFFCSVSPIWRDAIKKSEQDCKKIQQLNLGSLPISILPSYQIWEIDCQTMEINIIELDRPKREEVKKEEHSTRSNWVKEKSPNGKHSIYINKYETTSYSNYYEPTPSNLTDQNINNNYFYHKPSNQHGTIVLNDNHSLTKL